MKKARKAPRGKRVSRELSTVLNRVAGEIPARRRQEVRRLLGGSVYGDGYLRCTWWGGCYYCQDLQGRWRIIKCYA